MSVLGNGERSTMTSCRAEACRVVWRVALWLKQCEQYVSIQVALWLSLSHRGMGTQPGPASSQPPCLWSLRSAKMQVPAGVSLPTTMLRLGAPPPLAWDAV